MNEIQEEKIKKVLGGRMDAQIKRVRQNSGIKLTYKGIAEKLGVKQSTVSNWKSGHRVPRSQHLKDLAKLLNTSVDYLTGETDNPLPIDDAVNVRDLLETKQLVYDGEIISDDQKEQFLEILSVLVKSKKK
jgi:transcriptional regulator with XRE-family HTH domain